MLKSIVPVERGDISGMQSHFLNPKVELNLTSLVYS